MKILTKKLQEVVSGVKEEIEFTKRHFSALYGFFKNPGVAGGVVVAPMYDLGITLAIRMDEGTRKDNLYKIYGEKR